MLFLRASSRCPSDTSDTSDTTSLRHCAGQAVAACLTAGCAAKSAGQLWLLELLQWNLAIGIFNASCAPLYCGNHDTSLFCSAWLLASPLVSTHGSTPGAHREAQRSPGRPHFSGTRL